MKRSLMMCVAMSALVSTSAMASPDLANARNCMSCHAVSSKVLGPSFKDVAARYAGQKDAEAKLTAKVLKGGTGAWGTLPMPENKQLSEAEAKTLVKWILTIK